MALTELTASRLLINRTLARGLRGLNRDFEGSSLRAPQIMCLARKEADRRFGQVVEFGWADERESWRECD